MPSRILPCLVALASFPLVACYPYPEDPPYQSGSASYVRPTPAPHLSHTQPQSPNEAPKKPATAQTFPPAAPNPSPAPPKPPAKEKPPEPPTPGLPIAAKAPGKPGYVLSPYTGKLILARGIPSGTVVPDPDSPASNKKYFRIP